VINRLSGLFLSQRQRLNGWELPLTGLLLMVGLAGIVSTLQAAAPHQKAKAVDPTAVTGNLEAAAPSSSNHQAVNSTSALPPLGIAAPLPPNQAVNSTSVSPPVETAAPPSPHQAVDVTSITPKLGTTESETTGSQQQVPAGDAPVVAPKLTEAPPPQPNQSMNSSSGTMPSAKWNHQAKEERKTTLAQVPTPAPLLPDGTYLYGQSAEPQQIGKEYLVFEVRQGKVIGAMYVPHSEYSCFHGTLDFKQMNLTVVNPYNQTAFSHAIARAKPTQMATAGGQINLEDTYDSLTYPHTVQLEGYQPISQISDNDKQLLSTCSVDNQGQVGN